ncbi:M20 family metallopeptidase [Terriglobus tenax]|uniref:M20 family metallopeptidase n=1 Tax=Terriglobus tenax TaxID=1111115 RepID=UPI0021E0ACAE|nr:M20 family metallopeptidase [Terriglobus tenax]
MSLDLARILTQTQALVSIESPSDDKAAVDRCADVLLELASDLAPRIKRHKQKQYGDILELRFGPRRRSQKPIVLLGHLDTVWPVGTLETMPWRQTATHLYGPGVLDMKLGVVMALEALRSAPLTREVILLLVSEEEIGSPVSRPITEKTAQAAEAVFVLEPAQAPNWAYKTQRKGIGNYRLTVTGISAHAGVDPEKGHSATLELSRQLLRIAELNDLQRGITLNAGVIGGGTKSNVIAAQAWAEIDLRIPTARDGERIDRKLRALKPIDKACTLTVTGGINRPPMERSAGTVRLYRQAKKLAAQLGFQLDEAATGGGSDGNFTAPFAPTLDGMGAVGIGAHAVHEQVELSHILPRTQLLANMLHA